MKTADPRYAGISAPGRGPTWSSNSRFDDLILPSGKSCGASSNEELRAQLAKLGVEGAHTAGRDVLLLRYSALLGKVKEDAGHAAVDSFLKNWS
jgi:hypothetical protein